MIPFEDCERAFHFVRAVAEWRPVSVLIAAQLEPEVVPARRMTIYGRREHFKPEFSNHDRKVFFA